MAPAGPPTDSPSAIHSSSAGGHAWDGHRHGLGLCIPGERWMVSAMTQSWPAPAYHACTRSCCFSQRTTTHTGLHKTPVAREPGACQHCLPAWVTRPMGTWLPGPAASQVPALPDFPNERHSGTLQVELPTQETAEIDRCGNALLSPIPYQLHSSSRGSVTEDNREEPLALPPLPRPWSCGPLLKEKGNLYL